MHSYKITIIIHFSNENSTFKYMFFIEEITIRSLMKVVARLYFLLDVGVGGGGGDGDDDGGGGGGSAGGGGWNRKRRDST